VSFKKENGTNQHFLGGNKKTIAKLLKIYKLSIFYKNTFFIPKSLNFKEKTLVFMWVLIHPSHLAAQPQTKVKVWWPFSQPYL
jgi:hypothetical protein